MQTSAQKSRISSSSSRVPISQNGDIGAVTSLDGPKNFKDYLECYREVHKKRRYRTSKTVLIGRCQAIRKVREKIVRASNFPFRVLILGETGTGKEVVARLIHEGSDRSYDRFEVVNCSTLDTDLANTEIFGHDKGAFSGAYSSHKGIFEFADKGTLFLDEITETSQSVQAKLLRVIETGEFRRVGAEKPKKVDVRVIAGTNRDLTALSRKEKFRKDLYFRLAQFFIELPPLRERGSDVVELAAYYLAYFEGVHANGTRFNAQEGVLERLQRHEWQGNVRELMTVIENAVLTALSHDDDRIREEYIDFGPLYS